MPDSDSADQHLYSWPEDLSSANSDLKKKFKSTIASDTGRVIFPHSQLVFGAFSFP